MSDQAHLEKIMKEDPAYKYGFLVKTVTDIPREVYERFQTCFALTKEEQLLRLSVEHNLEFFPTDDPNKFIAIGKPK